MKQTLKLSGNPLDVTIGCDPEFEQTSNLGIYNPIPTTIVSMAGEVGKDGAGNPIEIRPGTHKNTSSMIKKLRELVKICPPMSTKGNRWAIGGHLHFGGVQNAQGKKIGSYDAVGPRGGRLGRVCVNPSQDLLKALDAFIGIPTSWANGSARSHYAGLGKYELKSYGFEYRSPSAAWMDNPEIATLTFQFVREIIGRACSNKGFTYEIYTDEQGCLAEGLPFVYGLSTLKSFKSLHHGKTEEEIIAWLNFFRNKEMTPTCNENWGGKGICKVGERPSSRPEPFPIQQPEPTVEPGIRFHDDWLSVTRATVRNTIANLRRIATFDIPITIDFFGLREDRGDVVYGGSCGGYPTISESLTLSTPNSFGIPFRLRNENNLLILERVIRDLITSRYGNGNTNEVIPNFLERR